MAINNLNCSTNRKWWKRLTASDRMAPTLRTYVTLWGGEVSRSPCLYQPDLKIGSGTPTPSEGEAPPRLAPAGAAEVFQAGMSASR